MSEEQLILELHHMFKTCDYNGEDDGILTDYDFIFKNITDLQKEIARLNKIIDDLEKELKSDLDVYICSRQNGKTFRYVEKLVKSMLLDRLKELKEDGKNE